MIFSSLSKKNINRITEILDELNLQYHVEMDKAVLDHNQEVLKDDLKHFYSPMLSREVLQITIEEYELAKIPQEDLDRLEKCGMVFSLEAPEFVERDLQRIKKSKNFKFEILIALAFIGIYIALRLL